jgi:hypothetical protein
MFGILGAGTKVEMLLRSSTNIGIYLLKNKFSDLGPAISDQV